MKVYSSPCDEKTIVVFLDDKEEPEWYSVEEFVAMYGEDALPEQEKDSLLEEYTDYWLAAIALIDAWAGYQAKRELFANVICEETRHRVLPTLVRYYDGDPMRLKHHIRKLYMLVCENAEVFRRHCRIYGLDLVTIAWLRKYLLDSKNYESLRGKCQRRRVAGKRPVSLSELFWKK